MGFRLLLAAGGVDFFRAGQKCSALSRLYVSSSVWNAGFKDQLLSEIAKIKVGSPTDWTNFMGPVMYVVMFRFRFNWILSVRFSGRPAFDKITDYIEKAKAAGGEILIGGSGTFASVSHVELV